MSHQYDHDHTGSPVGIELRVQALESPLQEKRLISPMALDELIDTYEHKIGPRNGTQVVAEAWNDPEYKRQLLANAAATITEPGFSGVQSEDMQVVGNTLDVHNVTTYALCSCYPQPVLGLPPVWYKSAPYRSRIVIDPRDVLARSGVNIPESKEMRAWDSSAELRYLTLSERPAGTDGWGEAQSIELVTHDSVIGTGLATTPQ